MGAKLDRNIERLLEGLQPTQVWESDHPCLQVLHSTLRQERRRRLRRHWIYPLTGAAAVFIAVLYWYNAPPLPSKVVGHIREIQGIMHARDNGHVQDLTIQSPVYANQHLETRSGSIAAIELGDASTLRPAPRTILKVNDQPDGAHVYLRQGALRIQAAKQAAGQALHVNTDSGAIKILGTELDVRLVQRPDGVQQTHVHLHSGRLELSSAGQSVLLQPGKIGVTQADRAPVTYAAVWEVNELVTLFERSRQLATERQKTAGLSTLIEFATQTVWTMIPLAQFTHTDTEDYRAELYWPAFSIAAYTLAGTPLTVTTHGNQLRLKIPQSLADTQDCTYVIVKIPQVQGLFQNMANSGHQFTRPGSAFDHLTLTALVIPEHAQVELQAGEMIEEKSRLGQRIVIALAYTEALSLFK